MRRERGRGSRWSARIPAAALVLWCAGCGGEVLAPEAPPGQPGPTSPAPKPEAPESRPPEQAPQGRTVLTGTLAGEVELDEQRFGAEGTRRLAVSWNQDAFLRLVAP